MPQSLVWKFFNSSPMIANFGVSSQSQIASSLPVPLSLETQLLGHPSLAVIQLSKELRTAITIVAPNILHLMRTDLYNPHRKP
jgi:hypothetical protein